MVNPTCWHTGKCCITCLLISKHSKLCIQQLICIAMSDRVEYWSSRSSVYLRSTFRHKFHQNITNIHESDSSAVLVCENQIKLHHEWLQIKSSQQWHLFICIHLNFHINKLFYGAQLERIQGRSSIWSQKYVLSSNWDHFFKSKITEH